MKFGLTRIQIKLFKHGVYIKYGNGVVHAWLRGIYENGIIVGNPYNSSVLCDRTFPFDSYGEWWAFTMEELL